MANTLFDGGFDQLDHAILQELQMNGRVSVADLARKIHLSPPAVYQRIKRLERAGVIRQRQPPQCRRATMPLPVVPRSGRAT